MPYVAQLPKTQSSMGEIRRDFMERHFPPTQIEQDPSLPARAVVSIVVDGSQVQNLKN